MKAAYFKARVKAEVPPGGWPESFAVITACNPDGVTIDSATNERRTEAFRQGLVGRDLRFFPVNGYDPDSPHEEPGFGVVCDEATALELGREWGQEAIFQVERGQVRLISCENPGENYSIQVWSEMVDPH
jgi:hypothetical protein